MGIGHEQIHLEGDRIAVEYRKVQAPRAVASGQSVRHYAVLAADALAVAIVCGLSYKFKTKEEYKFSNSRGKILI